MIRPRGPGDRIARMRLLVALLASLSLQAAAAPFAASIGGERLVLDAVPGMSDALPLGSPRVTELAESLTSASNRILLFALTDSDIRRFGSGEKLDLRRYMLLVTPGHLERERVTPEQFKLLVDDARRDVGEPANPADFAKYLEDRPEGRPSPLMRLKEGDGIFSVLVGTKLPGSGAGWWSKPEFVLSTSTFLLLRGKAVSLSVYTAYSGPQDLEWIRFVTERWVDTLQKLNAR